MPHGRTTPQGRRQEARFIGKDELNLADWPLGVRAYQQPLKADGGKVDYIETQIRRPDGSFQKVTRMAPSRIGLPTSTDDDVLLALLTLAKKQNFASDKMHFVPAELLRILQC